VVPYRTIIIEELLGCGKQIIINGKDYADMSSNCQNRTINLDLCPKLPNWEGTSAVAVPNVASAHLI
jgi:hypothetical protein